MNPEQWLSLKWNGGSTMSDRWLNQSKIIQLEKDAKGKDEKQRGIDSLIYAYLQVKYTQNKKWH